MKWRIALVPLITSLAGCATLTDTRTDTVAGYEETRRAPTLPITRNVTSFTEGLRCMDNMFVQYGTRASLMVEDLNDKTQKSAAGTTEMFIGAMSQMNRRSNAIRTIAFSDDTKNLANFMRHAGSKEAFQVENIPTYTVRGAISQFDDNLAKKTIDGGVSIGPIRKSFIGAGGAKSSSINMIAFDVAILRAQDFSVLPGVSAHNSAAILQEGYGIDAEVTYKKLGVNFMTSLAKSDGKTVALRNLVELGAIELMGKLNRIPYWRCIGASSSHPEVLAEIDDWFESMSSGDKVKFFLQQFRAIGMLPGGDEPIDPEHFKLAFRVYAEALGIPDNKTISLRLFRAHFAADLNEVGPQTIARFQEEKKKLVAIELKMEPTRARDEAAFTVTSNNVAYLYCFLQDEHKQVLGIFPHGLKGPAAVPAGQAISLREVTNLALVSHTRLPQTLACFASARDRVPDLPELFRTPAGAPIPGVTDLNAIKAKLGAGVQLALATSTFRGHPARQVTGPTAR